MDMVDNPCSSCLVGKFFTNSTPPCFEETEQSLRKQWKLSIDDLTVRKLDDDNDTFLFEFRQEKDKEEVLDELPVNVNGVILVIKDPNSSDDMVDFSVASFAVEMAGLPWYTLTQTFRPKLKSLLGGISAVLYRNAYLVQVDLKKPLNPGFYLENRFVQFSYRNLGDFCYNCGMIGHVKGNCDQVKFPKERALNATSTTHVYGPWLRVSPSEKCYQAVLMKSMKGVGECEKTLSYAQFFLEIEFNNVYVCNPRSETLTRSTHRFRFPCSYLDTETEFTDSKTATSKAYEVIQREIYENTPFSLGEFEDKPDIIGSLVEELKFKKKNEFCSEDKWLTLKLQINKKHMYTPVDYETFLALNGDKKCERLLESKILDLIKKRVEEKTNLLSLTSWEDQIRQVISEVGYANYMCPLDVYLRANVAMEEAVQMEISSSSCPKPADRSTVSKLKHWKVLGSDMDGLHPCTVCVGEMFLGEEATVLPCSHVFHSSCIEKWFQVGHKCPLCGFKLPLQK